MNYLNEEVVLLLESYQKKQVEMCINDFIKINEKVTIFIHSHCPKCNTENPILTKGGFTKKGKQMLRCGSCKKRFVFDSGQLTFYSQQSQSSWNEFIIMTLNGDSLDEAAAKLNVHPYTTFRMRHKMMHSLKVHSDSDVLSNLIEVDEIYVLESSKGQELHARPARKRGETATKRGLSNEQVCLITAIERGGNSYMHSYNTAKPKSDDIRIFANHIENGSHVFGDGLASFNVLEEEYGCTLKVLKGHESYDKVNHLNHINSLHSRIRVIYQKYRGIASKYINRYAALFSFQYAFRGMDSNEKLILLLEKLRKAQVYFTIKEIRIKNYLANIVQKPAISIVKSPSC